MNDDKAAIILDKKSTHSELNELRSLLEKQINLARQGNISSLLHLSKKTNALVEKIVQKGVFALPGFKNQRDHLHKLYEELCLVIATQKADVTEKLSHVRKGKRLIGSYRSNI